ncbi:MAG: hypothetical protein NMNS01_04120 [Nitrosomonas sp.]|nr:MAG: hypothetical protein NMNS01_04120 [Nitrosomonas sp.]
MFSSGFLMVASKYRSVKMTSTEKIVDMPGLCKHEYSRVKKFDNAAATFRIRTNELRIRFLI